MNLSIHPPVRVTPNKETFRKAKYLQVLAWSAAYGFTGYILAFSQLRQFVVSLLELDGMSALTSLGFFAAGILTTFIGAVISAVLYMWVFDDFKGWSRVSQEEWQITDNGIAVVMSDMGEQGSLSFAEIASVHRHFPKGIRLRLRNKQAVVMRFIPDHIDVIAEIRRRLDLHNALENNTA